MYQLRKKILPILLPYMVEAENFSDHPRKVVSTRQLLLGNTELFLRLVQVSLYPVSVYTVLVAETLIFVLCSQRFFLPDTLL